MTTAATATMETVDTATITRDSFPVARAHQTLDESSTRAEFVWRVKQR